jgi:hypothetical protein
MVNQFFKILLCFSTADRARTGLLRVKTLRLNLFGFSSVTLFGLDSFGFLIFHSANITEKYFADDVGVEPCRSSRPQRFSRPIAPTRGTIQKQRAEYSKLRRSSRPLRLANECQPCQALLSMFVLQIGLEPIKATSLNRVAVPFACHWSLCPRGRFDPTQSPRFELGAFTFDHSGLLCSR